MTSTTTAEIDHDRSAAGDIHTHLARPRRLVGVGLVAGQLVGRAGELTREQLRSVLDGRQA